MASAAKLARLAKDKIRRRELRRAQTDLFYLATKLGYGWNPAAQQGVTREFHGPLCERSDRLDCEGCRRQFTAAQRKGLKSTVFTICKAVQRILRNPDITGLVVHDVEDEAVKICQEVGGLFLKNEWLRSLDPIGVYSKDPHYADIVPDFAEKAGKAYRVCPNVRVNQNRWNSASGFTVNRPGWAPTTRRQKTLCARGTGSSTEGVHVDILFLDDIIGRNTIEDNKMPYVRRWIKQTGLNVLNTNGWIYAVGTRWDTNDIYADFIASKHWDTVVKAALENEEGEPDLNGSPTHFGPGSKGVAGGIEAAKKREKVALDEMGYSDYMAQRMNDPSPAGDMPWSQADCEHFISEAEALKGVGKSVVFSDPAPRFTGSFDGTGEKKRADGTKNYWSTCVLRFRVNKDRQECILMTGSHSREWSMENGMDEVCRQMMVSGTNYAQVEAYGSFISTVNSEMKKAMRRMGVRSWKSPEMTGMYKANAKNSRVEILCDWARDMRFLISEGCPKEFLHGDSHKTGFLTQMRRFRPHPGDAKRNLLPLDDDSDVVSMGTDPGVQQLVPQAHHLKAQTYDEWEEVEDYQRRSRYSVA